MTEFSFLLKRLLHIEHRNPQGWRRKQQKHFSVRIDRALHVQVHKFLCIPKHEITLDRLFTVNTYIWDDGLEMPCGLLWRWAYQAHHMKHPGGLVSGPSRWAFPGKWCMMSRFSIQRKQSGVPVWSQLYLGVTLGLVLTRKDLYTQLKLQLFHQFRCSPSVLHLRLHSI